MHGTKFRKNLGKNYGRYPNLATKLLSDIKKHRTNRKRPALDKKQRRESFSQLQFPTFIHEDRKSSLNVPSELRLSPQSLNIGPHRWAPKYLK
jgi:hypothetical protein